MTEQRPRVLVFGGDGQLGRDLARTAATMPIELQALPRSAADIADRASVERALREFRPAVAVNAAAYTRVDDAEIEIAAAERGNVEGPRVLAGACAAAAIPIVHVSTDYVFDGSKQTPYVESDPIAPIGVYGRTKADGETEIRSAATPHVILRVSWLYGEFGNNFLKTVLRLARERDSLRIVADQRGCPTSTRDLGKAILRIAPKLAAGEAVAGTYHFAGDGETTWHGFASEVVKRFAAASGRKPEVVPIATADYPTRAVRPQNSSLDCSKFHNLFGFKGRAWQQEVAEITDILVRPDALPR
jgi:dTDP-4-dehydrorhamnose reductase